MPMLLVSTEMKQFVTAVSKQPVAPFGVAYSYVSDGFRSPTGE